MAVRAVGAAKPQKKRADRRANPAPPGANNFEEENFLTHTTNFNLSQWAKSDRIQMADFNADNAKIDAALAARNCQLYTTTYTGNGGTVSLTFPHRPVAVFVSGVAPSPFLRWINGMAKIISEQGGTSPVYYAVTVTGGVFSWTGGGTFSGNVAGTAYTVVALLDSSD